MASRSFPCQGQISTAGKPSAAAWRMRSSTGSFRHHISTLTANFVCGVLPIVFLSEKSCSAARAAAAAPARTAEEPRNVRRVSGDILGQLLEENRLSLKKSITQRRKDAKRRKDRQRQ